jgi:hypothetical protein
MSEDIYSRAEAVEYLNNQYENYLGNIEKIREKEETIKSEYLNDNISQADYV